MYKTKDGCFSSSQQLHHAPGRRQRCRTRLLQNNDKGQCRGLARIPPPTGEHSTWLRRTGLLPPTENPHQSSAEWPAETGRTVGRQHCEHNINGQKFLEETVFRNIMKGQRVDVSKEQPRSMSSLHSRASHPQTQLQSSTQEGDNA